MRTGEPYQRKKPMCRVYKKAVLAKGGNTTNLLIHPELYAEAAQSISRATSSSRCQPTLQEVVTQSKAYDPKSQRAQEL